MKRLMLILLLTVIIGFSFIVDETSEANQCLDKDVWVYVKHSDPWEDTSTVIVHVPKFSLERGSQDCPRQDTKVVGIGRTDTKEYAGFHVVILKKGALNDPKSYTTRAPRKIEIPENFFDTWYVDK